MPPDETATTTTESPAAGSGGSEFSRPTGVKDDEIWSKHFGGTDEEPKEKKAKAPEKAEKKPEPKAKAEPKKDEPAKKPEAKAAPKKEEKPDAKADKAEPKTAKEPKEEPVTGKAKDLYEQAKQATSKVEARRLYKQAMSEAFGEVPPEFNESVWKAAREKREADTAKLATRDADITKREQALEGRLTDAVRQLNPAIHVMKLLKEVQGGDYTRFGELISKALDKPVDEAMKLFVRGVKVSPEGRAARAAAEAAERRAAQAEARIQEMERKLNEKDEVRTQAERSQLIEKRRAAYLTEIETELDGHPVLQLPRGKERVMAYILKTADKVLKTPKYSFDEAADRVVAWERKRLQKVKFLDTDGEEARPASRERVHASPRGETVSAGVQDESPEASFERIFSKHAPTRGRR